MPCRSGIPVSYGLIPLAAPEIRGNEWKYIKKCLDTGMVSSVGLFVDQFEREVAACVGAKYAVATVNGTSALHVALLVAGVKPEDEVLVSALTFIAPANAIRYVGAWPVFVDADPEYWQMDPQKVTDFLERVCRWVNGELRNRITGRRVKAILPVHILGHPVDMNPILELGRKYSLTVIEDATEGLGSKYKGDRVGHLGDVACFSFNGNKIITTGGGGMLVTDNETWATKARYLTTQAKDDPVEYIHNEIGYNYRLTNLQAAMGCAQLEQLDYFVSAKRRIADIYTHELESIPGITPLREASWAFSTFWLYTVLIDEMLYGLDSRALVRELAQLAIQSRPVWQPLHCSLAHTDAQRASDCSTAERIHRQALSLPCSVGLGNQQYIVLEALRRHS